MSRGEIMAEAHLNSSSGLAREYFDKCGLTYSDVNMNNCMKLRQFINDICHKLCSDESYSMVKGLEVNYKIKKDKWGFYLTMCGSYFDEREAVSFWSPATNNLSIVVGFCGWADGCNRIPVIQGFIKWCDWMKNNKDVNVLKDVAGGEDD